MNDIVIQRKHGKTLADARLAAEHMATKLKQKFDVDYRWDDDTMRFARPGVSGELMLEDGEAALRIRLGFLLSAVKPSVEREARKFFDENFAT